MWQYDRARLRCLLGRHYSRRHSPPTTIERGEWPGRLEANNIIFQVTRGDGTQGGRARRSKTQQDAGRRRGGRRGENIHNGGPLIPSEAPPGWNQSDPVPSSPIPAPPTTIRRPRVQSRRRRALHALEQTFAEPVPADGGPMSPDHPDHVISRSVLAEDAPMSCHVPTEHEHRSESREQRLEEEAEKRLEEAGRRSRMDKRQEGEEEYTLRSQRPAPVQQCPEQDA
jgi:hypothetical protein